MKLHSISPKPIRKHVTLTIPDDVLQQARALKLNTSQAAEAGIRDALRKALTASWLQENEQAIAAYNRDVNKNGLPLKPLWARS